MLARETIITFKEKYKKKPLCSRLITIMTVFAGERPTRFYLAKEEPDLTMEPNTGVIRIRLPLDRETRDKYILSVEARSGVTVGYCQVNFPPSVNQSKTRGAV